jgi:hypothetical protein
MHAHSQVVFRQELPQFGRRYPRKRQADGRDPDNEPTLVGGEGGVPDEIVADGSMSPRPLRQQDIQKNEEVVHEEDDYKCVLAVARMMRMWMMQLVGCLSSFQHWAGLSFLDLNSLV